jgi:transglutaminase-like putative cysteine protease
MLNIVNIPTGVEGIKETLERMVAMTRQAVRSEWMLVLSRAIARTVPTANDKLSEATAIFEWIRDNVKYVKDPVGVEMITTPQKLIETGAGDCDCLSMLLAAMVESIGIPARFVAIQTKPEMGYNHVYPEAKIDGNWIAFDLATSQPRVGVRANSVNSPLIYNVSIPEDRISGVISSTKLSSSQSSGWLVIAACIAGIFFLSGSN